MRRRLRWRACAYYPVVASNRLDSLGQSILVDGVAVYPEVFELLPDRGSSAVLLPVPIQAIYLGAPISFPSSGYKCTERDAESVGE